MLDPSQWLIEVVGFTPILAHRRGICLSRTDVNEDLHDEIFHYLYWFEEQVSANVLKHIFNMTNPMTFGDGVARTKTGKGIIRPASIEVSCTTCNQLIQIKISSRETLRHELRYIKEGHRRTCKECKAKVDARRYQAYQQELAEERLRFNELHTMPYYEYLQTPEWQETRKRAMKRAGFRCQVCNSYGVQLNVHHRTYERRGFEDNHVLCHDCHRIFHENGSLA